MKRNLGPYELWIRLLWREKVIKPLLVFILVMVIAVFVFILSFNWVIEIIAKLIVSLICLFK